MADFEGAGIAVVGPGKKGIIVHDIHFPSLYRTLSSKRRRGFQCSEHGQVVSKSCTRGIFIPGRRLLDLLPWAALVVLASYMGAIGTSTLQFALFGTISLAFVPYLVALAQTFATQRKEVIDANQELIAFGAACIFGSFNLCHVCTSKSWKSVIYLFKSSPSRSHNLALHIF